MGEMTEKAKGLTNEGIGNTKQAVADATNDPALKQGGSDQERKGEAQAGNDARRGDCDYKAVARNAIAVTPLHVDLTHHGSLATIRSDFAKKKRRQ